MPHRGGFFVPELLAIAAAAVAPACGAEAPVNGTAPVRIVAVGDLHGRFDNLVALLRAARLVDLEQRWIGGPGHLVVVGDVLDRGVEERPILDLLIRLEKEAAAAGGSASLLLGNHEVMNLVLDWRYVSSAGYEPFREFEKPEDRARALRFALSSAPRGSDPETIEAEFEKAHPEGWFGRARALGPEGDYARWLIGRPALLMIDGTLFVHGGISEATAVAGIDETNRGVARGVRDFWRLRETLEKAGAVAPFATFADLQLALLKLSGLPPNPLATNGDARARAAARELREVFEGPAFAANGPLWYRGLSLENERIECDVLAQAQELLGAKRLVVGHTPTQSRTVNARFGGGLYRIDVGMGARARPRALVFTGGVPQVLDPHADELLAVNVEPPQGETWTGETVELDDPDAERLLREGSIVDIRLLGRGRSRPQLVQLEADGVRMRAIFKTLDTGPANPRLLPAMVDRYTHEIAAYRLDRLLGLDMVPVTVERTIEGTPGSLQRWVESAVDQRIAKRDLLELAAPALLPGLLARAKVFDALIGNPRRSESDTLYVLLENRVLLVDHARAFGLAKDPRSILGARCALDAEFAGALRALDAVRLEEAIGPLVVRGAVDALLARRDRILATCRGT